MVKQDVTEEEIKRNKLEVHHTLFLILLEVGAIVAYALVTDYKFLEVDDKGEDKTVSKYYPMFQDVHVMIFIGFGFLMTFMRRYSFSSVGLNFLLAAITIQYAILINAFWHNLFAGHWEKVHLDITSLITGDFAAGAVLISFGAVLGKTSLEQLVCMIGFEIIFYAINESIGVIYMRAVDMGGSMFVHTFGAYFGLAASKMMTDHEKVRKAGSKFGSRYDSDMYAMIGAVFLWMFWPSFNGALAEGNQQHRVVVNTVLALTNSCVAAFLCSKLFRHGHKLDMVDIQNATLAGGVAVGSSADLVIDPAGALIIGFLGGTLSVVGYVFIQPFLEKKIGLHDTCGVHNLHGMPGVLGGLGGVITSGIIGGVAQCKEKLDSNEKCPAGAGTRSDGEQAGHQAATLVITLAISIIGGLITGFIMKKMTVLERYGEDYEKWGEIEDEEEAKDVN